MISAIGTKQKVFDALSEYMNEQNANLFIDFLLKHLDILDEDERFEVKKKYPKPNTNILAFMIPSSNYYINLKATTVLTICLLADITLRHIPNLSELASIPSGIGSILAILSVDINKRKLTDTQKQIVMKIASTKGKKLKESEILSEFEKEERSSFKPDIQKLVEFGVLKNKNEVYHYVL